MTINDFSLSQFPVHAEWRKGGVKEPYAKIAILHTNLKEVIDCDVEVTFNQGINTLQAFMSINCEYGTVYTKWFDVDENTDYLAILKELIEENRNKETGLTWWETKALETKLEPLIMYAKEHNLHFDNPVLSLPKRDSKSFYIILRRVYIKR